VQFFSVRLNFGEGVGKMGTYWSMIRQLNSIRGYFSVFILRDSIIEGVSLHPCC